MSKNNITGDTLRSKNTTEEYSAGWDLIFGKKPINTYHQPSVSLDAAYEEVEKYNEEKTVM